MVGKATARSIDDEEDLKDFQDEENSGTNDVDSEFEGGRRDEVVRLDDSGRLRLWADISLDGISYASKKSSRKVSFPEEEDNDVNVTQLGDRLQAAFSDGRSDDDEEEQWKKRNLGHGQDEELEALTREYEKLREEETKGIEILRGQEKDGHLKAQAVQHQKALWDRSLEVRISLQKLLVSANRLPRQEVKISFCEENEHVKKAYSSLTESAIRALDCLLDLGTALIENNSAIVESYSITPNANGKREAAGQDGTGLDRAWTKLDELCSKLVAYRDNALDRWQRKTQIYTGAVANVRLRAFNQSISQQVATSMRDSSRLVGRMRLKKGSVHVLGQPMINEVIGNLNTSMEGADEFPPTSSLEEEGDPETLDDSEFYQQLLREFLESTDPSALGNMNLYVSVRQQNKKRKKVDRRASKGRKIRYNIFEPLLNFMAPKPMVLPPMASHLFSNLFGQRTIEPIPT